MSSPQGTHANFGPANYGPTNYGNLPSAGYPPPAARPRRPGTLTAGLAAALFAAVLYVAGALLMIVSGKQSIRDYVTAELAGYSDDPALLTEIVDAQLDEAYGTLVAKAVAAIAVAVVIMGALLLARNGATWARATLAGVLVVAMCVASGLQVGEADVLPDASFVAALFAPAISIVAVVLLFLPASNRYATGRRMTGH